MSLTKSSIASVVIVGTFAALAGFLLLNRQWVIDQFNVLQYQPTSEIVSLADNISLTDSGRFTFYASRPSIESTQHFNEVCGSTEQSAAILGCYSGERVYVYNVTDARLDGIKEVTAAHEMLHAAYQRLSDSDKTTVNALLDAEYNKLKTDAKFAERMAFYAKSEPGERENELHSIIGSEISSISPELETYYGRYFTNRQLVLADYDKYSAVFKEIEAKSNQLSDSLTALSAKIDAETATYNSSVTLLNQDVMTFNARARSGGFSSQAQFSAEHAALAARSTALNNQRAAITADVALYEQQRNELKAISSEAQALNRSIDSKLAPAPSL